MIWKRKEEEEEEEEEEERQKEKWREGGGEKTHPTRQVNSWFSSAFNPICLTSLHWKRVTDDDYLVIKQGSSVGDRKSIPNHMIDVI